MSDLTPEQAFADVLGSLVRDHETTDVFAELVRECAAMLHVDAVALLVQNGRDGLELLSATSHRAAELELYQRQEGSGPCVDAARSGQQLSGVGAAEITARWHDVGRAIVDAGFLAVHAFPMTWHGRALGGLNVFTQAADPLAPSSVVLAQSFADVATIALTQPALLSDEDLAERVEAALEGRVVVERAKGVLAQTFDIDMEAAYVRLVQRALDNGTTLSHAARQIVHDAYYVPHD